MLLRKSLAFATFKDDASRYHSFINKSSNMLWILLLFVDYECMERSDGTQHASSQQQMVAANSRSVWVGFRLIALELIFSLCLWWMWKKRCEKRYEFRIKILFHFLGKWWTRLAIGKGESYWAKKIWSDRSVRLPIIPPWDGRMSICIYVYPCVSFILKRIAVFEFGLLLLLFGPPNILFGLFVSSALVLSWCPFVMNFSFDQHRPVGAINKTTCIWVENARSSVCSC